MQPPAVIAQVTGQDLLARLDTLSTNMATLTAKLDDIPGHMQRQDLSIKDLEGRVRVLEQARWKLAGASAAISALLAGGIVAAIEQAVRH